MEPILQLFDSLKIDVIVLTLLTPFIAAFLATRNTQVDGPSKSWLTTFNFAWSKIILDISLVWGISLACIGMIGMTVNMSDSARLAEATIIVFSSVATAGLAAAVAFCVENESVKVHIRLSPFQALLVFFLFFFSALICIVNAGGLGIGYFNLTITSVQLLSVGLFTLIGSIFSTVPWQQTIFKANLGVTLFLMTLGIISWFLNWSDFESSNQSTYLVAVVLMWGSFIHVGSYFAVMVTETQPDAKLRIKTWHFTEAFAFFAFLVYAPIGTTEYYRESADQEALQEQHEDQQSEIDSLKAELEDLKKQVST